MTKRDWKAITFDWLALEDFDDIDNCYLCLTQREIAILKASIIPAYWQTRWQNLGEDKSTLEGRIALIDAKLDFCGDTDEDSIIVVQNINTLQININQIKWDGSTTSINPDAPITTWNDGDTDDRNAALCMAVMSLVGTICALELQALIARYAGTALVFAGLFILTGGLSAFGVLLVGTLVAGFSFEVARDALEDRDAQLAVACCMNTYLQGEAVTSAVLSASLGACGFTPGSNAAIVRDYVNRSIQSEDTYFALVDAAGKAFVQASVLGIDLCECGQQWCYKFDFTIDDQGWTAVSPDSEYYPGLGFNSGSGQTVGEIGLYAPLFAERHLTAVTVKFASTLSGMTATSKWAYREYSGSGALLDPVVMSDGVTEINRALAVDYEQITLWIDSLYGSPSAGAPLPYVTEVILEGSGTNPFGADNC